MERRKYQAYVSDEEPFEHRKSEEQRSGDAASLAALEIADWAPNAMVKDDDEWEYISGLKSFVLTGVVTLASFVMMLDSSIVSTAIPRITSDFNSLQDIGWYGSAYLITNCVFQPMTGKIYSRFSCKYTFLTFLAIFELGSLICGLAQSSKTLIIGRAVAGIGTSGLINGALVIIAACLPMEKRAAIVGFMLSIAQLGILFGPLVGGLLTQYTSWRWCFYINPPFGVVIAVILFFIRIPDRIEKTRFNGNLRKIISSFDLQGFLLFAPTTVMFLLAMQWGGTNYPWSSPVIVGLFWGTAIGLTVFFAWEQKAGDQAMMPFSILKQRIIWSSCLTIFFFYGCYFIFVFYLPIYFQAVLGVSPTLSGVYTLPLILSQMFAGIVSGVLVGRHGYYLPWSIASGVLTSIASGLTSTFTPYSPTITWIGYSILCGVGRGFGTQMPILAAQNHLPPEQNSIGMSIVVFFQTFGGALFLAFAQIGFSSAMKEAIPKLAPEVNVRTVLDAGAAGFRYVIPASSIEGVILAYNESINIVFYIAAGAAVASFASCWGTGWKSIKKAKASTSEP